MKDKTLPDEGLEKAELQLDFFGKDFRFRDPMKYPEIFENYPKKRMIVCLIKNALKNGNVLSSA